MRFIYLLVFCIISCTNRNPKVDDLSTDHSVPVQQEVTDTSTIISYTADPKTQTIQFYLKNDSQQYFKNIGNLKNWLDSKKQTLVFAMNGGMYKEDNSPLGLYIENGKTISPINKKRGTGNFYLQPNGIFYITADSLPVVCETKKYNGKENIIFATQSGPMLVINGNIHPAFQKGSANLTIRNGVGILPGNKIVFILSKKEISLYDFAAHFKDLGCKNALYLDGFISKVYIPEQNWMQTDGNFGVIIGVTEKEQ
jgi:uncharacterized protein YigE (DUF2233 family)